MYEIVINPGTDSEKIVMACKSWVSALVAKRRYECAGYTVDVMEKRSTEF